ncbi:hypothetical protein ABPG74_002784 [Tetrahymena malaccensis]
MSDTKYNSSLYEGNLKLNHEVINNSNSKQLYSFTKAKRFIYQKPACAQAFYDLPDVKDKRSALMGSGQKVPISNTDKTIPSPQDYILKSYFEDSVQKQRGVSFKNGRDKTKFGNMFNNQGAPGVGQYIIKSDFEKLANKGYTMMSKNQTQSLWNIKAPYPGPGSYNQINPIDPKQIVLSTMKKYQGYAIPHSKRFANQRCSTPGPGQYNDDKQKLVGQYINSRQRSISGTRFTTENRNVFQVSKQPIPGPGSYRAYTEFGDGDYDRPKSQFRMRRTYSTPSVQATQ